MPSRRCRSSSFIFALLLTAAAVARADEGMWTFDNFPSAPLEQR
jgi:hypothetical protein